MSTAPKIENVHYDETCPIMDRDQIDTLILGHVGDTDTSLVRELFDLFVNEGATKLEAKLSKFIELGHQAYQYLRNCKPAQHGPNELPRL